MEKVTENYLQQKQSTNVWNFSTSISNFPPNFNSGVNQNSSMNQPKKPIFSYPQTKQIPQSRPPNSTNFNKPSNATTNFNKPQITSTNFAYDSHKFPPSNFQTGFTSDEFEDESTNKSVSFSASLVDAASNPNELKKPKKQAKNLIVSPSGNANFLVARKNSQRKAPSPKKPKVKKKYVLLNTWLMTFKNLGFLDERRYTKIRKEKED